MAILGLSHVRFSEGIVSSRHLHLSRKGLASGRADRNMGPQPAAALPVLTLRPDKAAEHKRSGQTYQRIEEIADSEGVQESHIP